MDNINLPAGCITVEGPAGLAKILDEFLIKSSQDKKFAAEPHYILYQLGNQRSLIKVDMSKTPYQFWYGDLLGRPATKIVKETIARFLLEKCGEYYWKKLKKLKEEAK